MMPLTPLWITFLIQFIITINALGLTDSEIAEFKVSGLYDATVSIDSSDPDMYVQVWYFLF